MAEGGHYDIVVLGGGSGGYACALRAAEFGKRVALIEKDKVGGTCLHRGCIPTKALLHAAEVADSARESEKFGIKATLEGIEMPAVLSYQQGVVDRLWKGLQSHAGQPQDRHDRRRRAADLADRRCRWTATRSTPATTSCWPPGRSPSRCPAWRSTATG